MEGSPPLLQTWWGIPSRLIECAGDRVEKRLVLVCLRSGYWADVHACVSFVHVDCIAAGARRRHVALYSNHPSSHVLQCTCSTLYCCIVVVHRAIYYGIAVEGQDGCSGFLVYTNLVFNRYHDYT